LIRKFALGIAAVGLAGVFAIGLNPVNALATAGKRVDCGKVVSEVQAGKKTKDIAKDLSISTSSVYRCKKLAAASSSKKTVVAEAAPVTATPPAAASSTKAAAPPAAASTVAK
jgi:uncharacterized protein (DUF433 family)